MNNAKLYVIDYTLHGTPKSFIIRSDKMDNASLALGELRRRRRSDPAFRPGKGAEDQ